MRGHDLLVGVMGPLEVWGAKPFTRAKALELVVYLTLHPGAAVDAERLMDALWPGWQLKEYPAGSRRPTHRTLHTTTTSVARDCLGTGPSGQRRLPHLHGNGSRDSYRLLDVALDFQLLCDAVARAGAVVDVDRAEAKRELREGLKLVRGVPFEGVRDVPSGYQWSHVSGAIGLIERRIREAALQLAKLCLDDDDPEGAAWAARQREVGRTGPPAAGLCRDDRRGAGRQPRRGGGGDAGTRRAGRRRRAGRLPRRPHRGRLQGAAGHRPRPVTPARRARATGCSTSRR
ncbi:MAG: hypothetical protein ABR540_16635 [Acidimicrobiales bacterium]